MAPKRDLVTQILTLPLAILTALVPIALKFHWGRRLALLADDPALPERLLANRKRNSVVGGCAFGLLIALAPAHRLWLLPLFLAGQMAAAYPLRKTLYQETWSLFGYFSFFLRLLLAGFGFWILLASLPALTAMAGSYGWMAASALAALLLAWSTWSSDVFRLLLRAKPIDDPQIVSRFTELCRACGLPPVRLDRIDLNGGVFANAAALPSASKPRVVVSETLLARLEPDETVAILAHELAHLEYYNRHRLRVHNLITWTLVALSAFVVPALRSFYPEAIDSVAYTFPVVVLVAVIVRAQHRQKHETASDLRAAALTGDPEALVRALSKLHAFARLPRRWDTEFERNATHPSLARRVQAIRAAAGASPASLAEAAAFSSADQVSSVTFHDDRLVWQESALESHTIDYGRLSELRIQARAAKAAQLVAVDQAKRRWEIVVQPADVGRLQAVLDIVDTRLGHVPAQPPSQVSAIVVRLCALMLMIVALGLSQYSVFVVGLFALAAPSPALTAAAGVAGAAGAAIVWRDGVRNVPSGVLLIGMVAVIFGLLLIGISIANRRDREQPATSKLIGALGILAVLAFGLMLLGGVDAFDLRQSARQWPAAAVFLSALAASLAFARPRPLRYVAAAAGVAAAATISLGTTAFLHLFVSDPLLTAASPMHLRTLSARPLAEFPVSFSFESFLVSPSGRSVAFVSEDMRGGPSTIHAGRTGGTLQTFEATRVMFVDDDRLLRLDSRRGKTVLSVVSMEAGAPSRWLKQIDFESEDISIDGSDEEWRLLGFDGADIVSVSGKIGGDAVREERWRTPVEDNDNVRAVAASRERVLALETRFRSWFLDRSRLWRLALFVRPEFRYESRLWTIDAHGRSMIAASRLEVRCPGRSFLEQRMVCTAYDGSSTSLFSVDPSQKQLIPLASLPGHLYLENESTSGWLTGYLDWRSVAVRARSGEAIAVEDGGGKRAYQLAPSERVLGAIWSDRTGLTTVRLYSLD